MTWQPVPATTGLLTALFAAAAGVPAMAGPSSPVEGPVRYIVTPVRTDGAIHLRVSVRFQGEADGSTRFAPPEDRFGVAEMDRWIRELEAEGEARLTSVEPGIHRVEHEPGFEVEVDYTVAFDPDSAGFIPFGPSVGPGHFHFFGSQWMARVGTTEEPRQIEVAFDDDSWEGGALGSSFGLGPGPHRAEAGDYDLDYSVIAGGDYRTRRSECRGRPVLTLVQGELEVPDERIFPLVDRIVCGQRNVFQDFDRPFFTVFMTERDDLEAGAPVLNGFTAFLEPGVEYGELRYLLAHEMVHTWFPRTARLVEAGRPDAPKARTRWFHEGFTEYLARRILKEQGLVPLSRWVERTNEDLERLSYHPYRTLSLDELEAAVREGRYTNYHHRLQYVRGALIALAWDARIRRASGGEASLLEAVREVVDRAEASDGTITTVSLASVFETHGVDAEAYLRRHLETGEPIPAPHGAFRPEYKLGVRRVPSFRPGLDVRRLLRDVTVQGLEPDAAAARAGLQEGMEVVDVDNGAPWIGRWDPEEPTVVVVETEDGERTFTFSARGPEKEIPTFLAVRRTSSRTGSPRSQ